MEINTICKEAGSSERFLRDAFEIDGPTPVISTRGDEPIGVPMPTRAGQTIGTRASAAVSIHSAPLVLPVCGPPIEDGAVLVRGDRVLRIGPRTKIETT
jgi:hypothetical protein